MKSSIYIETTIPSYLTAWPSRDLIRAAHQQITRDWWTARDRFVLYTSRMVIEECGAGDPRAAADRLAAMADISLLETTPDTAELVEKLLRGVPLPARASADTLHIAIAAVQGIEYLLTWNCTHIANAILRPRIEAVCREAGCEPPMICTPTVLLPGGQTDDRG